MSTDPSRLSLEHDPRVQRIYGVTYHGNHPIDVPYMTEITNNLWQGGCIDGLTLPGEIKHLVSLYTNENYTVGHTLSSSLRVRMYDSLDQTLGQVDALAAWVTACRDDAPVLVHCQAGLNRSGIVVARALMLDGASADEAISLIREKRSAAAICNPAFEEWLRSI